MIKNYLLIAIRNLLKSKVFSFINVTGLSIGITCCLLLALFIKDEMSYEKHFDDYSNIYRITSTLKGSNWTSILPASAPPTVPALVHEFPEILAGTRLALPPDVQRHYIRFGDKGFYEEKGCLVDSTFFNVFSYDFEEGDRRTVFHAPSTVVLSHELAHKIFNNGPYLDQLLIINSGSLTDTFRVSGVLKPFVNPSQVNEEFYMSMNSRAWGKIIGETKDWSQTYIYSFIRLKPGSSSKDLEAKIPKMMDKYGKKEMNAMGFQNLPGLQPLEDMHLYSSQMLSASSAITDLGTTGNINGLYMMGSICLLILLIACINFMNLTTAKSFQRSGEIGIRKTLGATRIVLIRQFLGESLVIVFLAMVLSLVLIQTTLPLFNLFTQKSLSINIQNTGFVFVALLVVSLGTGIIAGSYPAFFLSSFNPVRALKEKFVVHRSSNWLRKSLVIFQFVIAITLISSMVVIQKQMNFMQHMPLGFDANYKITLPLQTDEAKAAYRNLKSRYQALAGVKIVSASSALPSTSTIRGFPLFADGSTPENAQMHFWISVDEDYLRLLDVKLIAGRNLDADHDAAPFGAPITRVMVNRASLLATGIREQDAIGSKLHVHLQGMPLTYQIVGVIEDFHQFSMHRKVTPLLFTFPAYMDYSAMCLQVDAASYEQTLASMQKIWKELVPNTVFEHSMLADNIQRQYDSDQRLFALIMTFTFIAIILSCLGLYGLSIFMAERRLKEIGIRKVLGASVSGIVKSLSMDFIKLVAIAFVVAVPIGYYAMDKWLENFAYKTELSGSVFMIAGFIAFFIAWMAIGFESIRAATGNPVDSLRSE